VFEDMRSALDVAKIASFRCFRPRVCIFSCFLYTSEVHRSSRGLHLVKMVHIGSLTPAKGRLWAKGYHDQFLEDYRHLHRNQAYMLRAPSKHLTYGGRNTLNSA
jgi:hypothetical protein